MKRPLFFFAGIFMLLFFLFNYATPATRMAGESENESPTPSDWFWMQRAYPYNFVPASEYYAAVDWGKQSISPRDNSLNWVLAGPTNVGGRITDVAMHASDLQTIYVATASGGVWKSSDAGYSWVAIADNLPSLSIGDLAIDPSDKNTIYCGTGETNGGGGSVTYDGRGIFKSIDAGQSWLPCGLDQVGSIGRIEVDSEHPHRIFVAAMGHLFENNPERGVYRSDDGGQHWDKILFVNDSVGAIDIAIHPLHPDTVFAVTWERIRRPNQRIYGGPGCAIWRSTNGGNSWNKLTTGLPGADIGRIGISIASSSPNIVYAIYATETGYFKGIYKSLDNGDSWTMVNGGDPSYANYGWWFGQIRVNPTNATIVYTLGVQWMKTDDSGNSWAPISSYHDDYHALYIHPANPNFQVVGNDGGIYISSDGGASWTHRPFPVTQFYTSEIDFQHPTSLYGGAQDNSTWRTVTGGIDDWEKIGGGDGFVTLVNPIDNSIYYTEFQYGGLIGSNGAVQPGSLRYNWNTPYVFEPNNPQIMYFGAEKLFKSINGGLTWNAISNDLSNGSTGNIVYGTISTISVSPVNSNLIYAGTDDGNVWKTSNGGANWSKISTNLPKRWVTRVIAHKNAASTAFVCLSGYRHADNMAHIYKTDDQGETWSSISGNLPDVPVNDLIMDNQDPNVLYIATDAGVFVTLDGGTNWQTAGASLPNVPVLDLTLHEPTRTLIAATYGRSMFRATLPIYVGTQSPTALEDLHISPNPFSNNTSVSFSVLQKQTYSLELFNSAGEKIISLFSGELPVGKHRIELKGEGLPAGVYILKMNSGKGAGFYKKIVKV